MRQKPLNHLILLALADLPNHVGNAKQIAKAVLARGYITKSKKFENTVRTALHRLRLEGMVNQLMDQDFSSTTARDLWKIKNRKFANVKLIWVDDFMNKFDPRWLTNDVRGVAMSNQHGIFCDSLIDAGATPEIVAQCQDKEKGTWVMEKISEHQNKEGEEWVKEREIVASCQDTWVMEMINKQKLIYRNIKRSKYA